MSKERTGQRHKNQVYFRDSELDFYLQAFPLGYQTYGGATVGEVFYAASRINEKDPDSWVEEWTNLAARLEGGAVRSLERGHTASARRAYLRAFTYYRTATPLLRAGDPRFRATWEMMRSCFRKATELFDPPIESVEIPFEGGTLPAYFMRAQGDGGRRPTLIMVGGGETYAEDLDFWGRRGGQGLQRFAGRYAGAGCYALRGNAPPFRCRGADGGGGRSPARTIRGGPRAYSGLWRESGRLHRASSTPIVDWHQALIDAMPPALRRAPRFLFGAVTKLGRLFSPTQQVAFEKFFEWQVGAEDIPDALEKFRPWKVDVARISCPVLCMVGTGEAGTFKKQTYACYAALRSPKGLRVFTEEEGADAHSQATNLRLAHQAVFDFFDDTFARGGRGSELKLAKGHDAPFPVHR